MTAPTGIPERDKLRLRLALKDARTARKLTQQDVADAMDWSKSKVVRIETGTVGISITDLKALLFQYEITDKEEVGQMVELARAAKKASWWHPYREHYSRDFLTFLDLEASSIRLRQFQILVVPGLLQSPDYSRAIITALSAVTPEKIERGHMIRMRRQELISKDGPKMFFILDESVLYRKIGDTAVMRNQLERLKELSAHPNLSIQILPFSAGAHAGMQNSFEIFELSEEPSNYALLLERIRGDKLFAEPSPETAEYVQIFQQLEKLALPAAETPKVIDERLSQMNDNA